MECAEEQSTKQLTLSIEQKIYRRYRQSYNTLTLEEVLNSLDRYKPRCEESDTLKWCTFCNDIIYLLNHSSRLEKLTSNYKFIREWNNDICRE